MQQHTTDDRSQVIFMGGLISAVLGALFMMLAVVPM